MNNTLKITTLVAAGLLTVAPAALALDGKVVLDQLVKKGVVTPEEADAILQKDADKQKDKPAVPTAKMSDVKKLTIAGRAQVQYKYFDTDDHSPGRSDPLPSQGFELRRFNIDADAELAKDFTAFGSIESTVKADGSATNIFIDKAGVSFSDRDAGKFTAGLQKNKFGLEEYTSASSLYAIERGVVSQFFAGDKPGTSSLGLGGRKIGFFWETAADNKDGGLKLHAGVHNAIQCYGGTGAQTTLGTDTLSIATTLGADYVIALNSSSKLQLGANYTYNPSNVNALANVTNATFNTETHALELIAKYTSGGLTLVADGYVASIENGRYARGVTTNAEGAMPTGFTLTAAYKVTDELEPVIALGYLNGDGRGFKSSLVRDSVAASGSYDQATSVYAGLNWYITPKSLKLSAGAEWASFGGRENSSTASATNTADVVGGRVQIQALF